MQNTWLMGRPHPQLSRVLTADLGQSKGEEQHALGCPEKGAVCRDGTQGFNT